MLHTIHTYTVHTVVDAAINNTDLNLQCIYLKYSKQYTQSMCFIVDMLVARASIQCIYVCFGLPDLSLAHAHTLVRLSF